MTDNPIRFATAADYAAILNIYAPYILETAFTFECDVPAPGDFSRRMADIAAVYPCLVWEEDGKVAAYAYGSRFAERAAYRYSVGTSIYVEKDRHGRGIGRKLYAALLEHLARRGYYNAIGVVATPNPASERLHQSFGFEEIGRYEHAGYKFGRWYGVASYRKALRDFSETPDL